MKKLAWMCVAALWLASSGMLWAQPLADRVPADALIYLGWQGTAELGDRYDGSHLKGMIEAVDLPQLRETIIQPLLKELGQEEAEAAETMRVVLELMPVFWQRPSALAVMGLDQAAEDAEPMPRLVLVTRAGEDVEAVLEQLQSMVAQLPEEVELPVRAFRLDDLVAVAVGYPQDEMALAGEGDERPEALAGAAKFQQALKAVKGEGRAAIAYVDVAGILKMVEPLVGAEGDGEEYRKAIAAIGIDGLEYAVYAGGFAGANWQDELFLAAPAPRRGVLAMWDAEPLPAEAFRAVSRNATMATLMQLDLAQMYERFIALTQEVREEEISRETWEVKLKEETGLDLREDVLAPLGETWVVYSDPVVVGPAFPGLGSFNLLVLNRLEDPERARGTLDKVAEMIRETLAEQTQGTGPRVRFNQTEYKGIKIDSVNFMFVTPAWTVHEGHLIVGLTPQAVVFAANQLGADQPTLLDSEAFAQVREALPVDRASTLTFVDLPQTAPGAYQQLVMLSQMLPNVLAEQGVEVPPLMLPPYGEIQPHVTPAGQVGWVDDAGWHSRSITPFPGAEVLLSGQAMTANPAMLGLGAGIMLPALGRAKEIENRAVCAANMSGTYKAAYTWSITHDDQFPPSLGALVMDGSISPRSTVCPSSGIEVPEHFGSIGEAAAWVEENSTYIYLGDGQTSSMSPDAIFMYEELDNHQGDGINVTFGDGHVSFEFMEDAMRLLEEQGVLTSDEEQEPLTPGPRAAVE